MSIGDQHSITWSPVHSAQYLPLCMPGTIHCMPTYPGYKYLGPQLGSGTDLGDPIDELDAAAKRHDIGYGLLIDQGRNPYIYYNEYDKQFLDEIEDLETENLYSRTAYRTARRYFEIKRSVATWDMVYDRNSVIRDTDERFRREMKKRGEKKDDMPDLEDVGNPRVVKPRLRGDSDDEKSMDHWGFHSNMENALVDRWKSARIVKRGGNAVSNGRSKSLPKMGGKRKRTRSNVSKRSKSGSKRPRRVKSFPRYKKKGVMRRKIRLRSKRAKKRQYVSGINEMYVTKSGYRLYRCVYGGLTNALLTAIRSATVSIGGSAYYLSTGTTTALEANQDIKLSGGKLELIFRNNHDHEFRYKIHKVVPRQHISLNDWDYYTSLNQCPAVSAIYEGLKQVIASTGWDYSAEDAVFVSPSSSATSYTSGVNAYLQAGNSFNMFQSKLFCQKFKVVKSTPWHVMKPGQNVAYTDKLRGFFGDYAKALVGNADHALYKGYAMYILEMEGMPAHQTGTTLTFDIDATGGYAAPAVPTVTTSDAVMTVTGHVKYDVTSYNVSENKPLKYVTGAPNISIAIGGVGQTTNDKNFATVEHD